MPATGAGALPPAGRMSSSSAPASAGSTRRSACATRPVDVTVVDRRNYHLFQPLLYQVATAGLSPAQIAMPIRRILARQKNATVLMEKVEAVDPAARIVTTTNRRIFYDYPRDRHRRAACLFRP